MASLEERAKVDAEGNERTVYLVRWRDPDGNQRSKTFEREKEAKNYKTNVEADLLRGEYIDPTAGKVTFKTFATEYLDAQTNDSTELVRSRLRLHVYPVLGGKRMNQIRPSTIQARLRSTSHLAENYRRVIFEHVSTVLSAAVDDEVIRKNPCKAASVSRPRLESKKVKPWSAEWVAGVRRAVPDRYAVFVTIAAGLGLRQGEVFGLSPDDVDWLRGEVEVQRQVRVINGTKLVFALPKGGKARTVPLPSTVREDLAAYLAKFPAREVTLPWRQVDGKPVTARLVLTTPRGEQKALNRKNFNPNVWKPALEATGIPSSRENGCHALRHFYASTLLDAGETIKAVSEYLGHSDPGFTLRTYTHLMPSSADRTRKAVDAAMVRVLDVYQDPKSTENQA